MLGKNVIEDYRDKIAASAAEAAIHRSLAAQYRDINPLWADMYEKCAAGVLREAERCRRVLRQNGIAT